VNGRPGGAPALILALDTATDLPSFALGTPPAPGEDVRPADRRDLSRDIERIVDALLVARGASPRDLSAVLVADGPGTFTGLRIGAAFAKGLCRALGLPLLSAPSLLGAAAAAVRGSGGAAPGEVTVAYDALRGECFRAVYRVADDGIEVLRPPALAPAADVPEGPSLHAREADASAAALLGLVGRRGGPEPVADPARWEPVYGRLAEAEARRIARERGAHGP